MLKLGVLIFLISSTYVNSQCFYKDDSSKKLDPQSRENLYRGQLDFTLHLFNEINKEVPNDNIFFSPFSIYHALLLGYFSSAGQTEQSLKGSLKIPDALDKINLMTAYKVDKRSRATNNNSDSYEFINANKMFVDRGVHVRDCMLDLFSGELEALNFNDEPSQSREYINNWVAKITKNNIKNLLPHRAITQATKLVLANAAYFKGVWSSKFPAERTKKEPFFVSETRQTLVPFMKQKGTFHFMVNDDLGAQILELPYKGNDISMYILLPPYSMKEGVTNIIAKLTPERLAAVVEESYMGREVVVEIPKFTIEKELGIKEERLASEKTVHLMLSDPVAHGHKQHLKSYVYVASPNWIKQILEAMGVGDLFQGSANFSTLTDDRNVQFDDAIHKAKIQIDEEGTTAAAATAIFGFRSSRPAEPTVFIANFPFVYIIYERPTNSVLFMGVYRDPKK